MSRYTNGVKILNVPKRKTQIKLGVVRVVSIINPIKHMGMVMVISVHKVVQIVGVLSILIELLIQWVLE